MRILIQYVVFVLIGVVVYGLCRLLRLTPAYPKIDKPKLSAVCSLAAVFATMLIFFVIMLVSHKRGQAHGVFHHRQQLKLADQVFLLIIYLLPMAFMLRLNGETLQSVGVTRADLWKATLVGLFLAATTLFFGKGGPSAALKLTQDHNLRSLVCFSFIGFGEEILFRGYLQSRLIAWLGRYQGWILASVVMALGHVPDRVFQGLGFAGALESSLGLTAISLLMGFVMMRTGNAVSSGLFHTFANWN